MMLFYLILVKEAHQISSHTNMDFFLFLSTSIHQDDFPQGLGTDNHSDFSFSVKIS